jgi:hypothetical protein
MTDQTNKPTDAAWEALFSNDMMYGTAPSKPSKFLGDGRHARKLKPSRRGKGKVESRVVTPAERKRSRSAFAA